jgi:hypothetical protein
MAPDEQLCARLRTALSAELKGAGLTLSDDMVEEKNMFGGLCIMLCGSMCCGVHGSKEGGNFMVHIGKQQHTAELLRLQHVKEWGFCKPGRSKPGFVTVLSTASDAQLRDVLRMAVRYASPPGSAEAHARGGAEPVQSRAKRKAATDAPLAQKRVAAGDAPGVPVGAAAASGSMAAATAATDASGATSAVAANARHVSHHTVDADCSVASLAHVYVDEVVGDAWHALMTRLETGAGLLKAYTLQLLETSGTRGPEYYCFKKWGRVGGHMTHRLNGPVSKAEARRDFESKFLYLTKHRWADRADYASCATADVEPGKGPFEWIV